MRTKTRVLNEGICCWIYTINPSARHRPMAIRVKSGTSVMCTAMAPPDQRECVPTSSRANPGRAAPTRLHSTLTTTMMLEALTEQRP